METVRRTATHISKPKRNARPAREPGIDRAFRQSKGMGKKKKGSNKQLYYFNNELVNKKTDPRNAALLKKMSLNGGAAH